MGSFLGLMWMGSTHIVSRKGAPFFAVPLNLQSAEWSAAIWDYFFRAAAQSAKRRSASARSAQASGWSDLASYFGLSRLRIGKHPEVWVARFGSNPQPDLPRSGLVQ